MPSDRRWCGSPVKFKSFGFNNTQAGSTALGIAEPGKTLVVLNMFLKGNLATDVALRDSASTAGPFYLGGPVGVPMAAGDGFRNESEYGLFETGVGSDIVIVQSASCQLGGGITYAAVKQTSL